MKKIAITTLGCKVNQFESASFINSFEDAGFEITKENADVIIVNTCAVTNAAGSQSRQTVRQALRNHPKARIIITGCYVEIGCKELEQIEELQGREYQIIGNSCKDQLVSSVLQTDNSFDKLLLGTIGEAKDICRLPVRKFGDRTRTYLRIQDGCESFCTYCIVPFTRGPSRSLPLDEVMEQAKIFADAGYTETVLTGIHIGAWGKDLIGEDDFTHLMDQLSANFPEMRFRISSLEPIEITDELLHLVKTRHNIFPHLHIPLQSASDEILDRMNRRYTTSQFKNIIDKCHRAIPDLCIGIDILAGFPGETEKHFEDAYSYLQDLNYTYLHVFPYSIRPGTKASEFTDQIHGDIKTERVKRLRSLSDQKKMAFYESQLGKTLPIQVEGKRTSDGKLRGYTDNYVLVHFDGPDSLMRTTTTVNLLENNHSFVLGDTL